MANKKIVLISGVNGYIAAQIAVSFLRAGWAVRGTVRNAASANKLTQALKEQGLDTQFDIAEVKDITAAGAFNNAVKGVTAIAHVASYVSFAQADPEPVIQLAVGGTETILKSAIEHGGPQLKTVILASSSLTIWEPNKPGHVFTDSDWDTFAPAQVRALGRDTPGNITYMASKVASEQAFWKFQRDEKPGFAMTAINPALVYGPPLFLPDNPEKLSLSVKPIWQVFSGQKLPKPTGGSGSSVDVRDVARLFVFAAENPENAGGKRYLAASGIADPQAIADILNDAFPERGIQRGQPGVGYSPSLKTEAFDTSRAENDTGKGWISLRESVVDTAKVLEGYL